MIEREHVEMRSVVKPMLDIIREQALQGKNQSFLGMIREDCVKKVEDTFKDWKDRQA
jgi:hypothetical protein